MKFHCPECENITNLIKEKNMAWPQTVRKSDLKIEYYRGSGKGGQHRNKRDTACRITHKETGISATAEDHKSQAQNRKAAFRRLSVKLVPIMIKAAKRSEPEAEAAKRVRTYHQPRQKVIDDRVKDKAWSYDDVINGRGLQDVIETVLKGGKENERQT